MPRCRVDRQALDKPDSRIPTAQFGGILMEAERRRQDPLIGMHAESGPSPVGAVGELVHDPLPAEDLHGVRDARTAPARRPRHNLDHRAVAQPRAGGQGGSQARRTRSTGNSLDVYAFLTYS